MTFLRYALILPIALLSAQSLAADTREDILAAIEYYADLYALRFGLAEAGQNG